MITRRTRSIRRRVAVAGSAIVLATLAALLAAVATTSTTEISDDGTTANIEENTLEPLPTAVAWTAAAAVVVAVGSMWVWAKQAVRPIQSLADVADSIQSESLDQRIRIDDAPAELEGLIDSFNAMLDRLEAAHIQQRELIEDTSHEIRTPLAAVALSLELAANDPDTTADTHRRNAEEALVLVEELNASVDDLLSAARRHSQHSSNTQADLGAVATRVVERHRLITPEVRLRLLGPAKLLVPLRAQEVERALDNLLANAINASAAGDTVTITTSTTGQTTVVSVEDVGPGIPVALQTRVFERYESGGEGSGLGLAIVKAIADSTGSITVTSPVVEGRGTRFEWTIHHS
ncbi:MAG: ATP-binding protein [Acidimicrobiales bacterium]